MTSEPASRRVVARALAAAVLVAVLAGLFVAAGTDAPDPGAHDYPDEDDVGPDRAAYVGQRVTLGGRVVGTDPLRMEVTHGVHGAFTVTVTGVDREAAEGDHISVFGTLEDESTVAAERVVLREPWEIRYMYAVSFVGGVWVLARTLRRWRFDGDRLAFVPREEPPSARGDGDA